MTIGKRGLEFRASYSHTLPRMDEQSSILFTLLQNASTIFSTFNASVGISYEVLTKVYRSLPEEIIPIITGHNGLKHLHSTHYRLDIVKSYML